MTIQRNSKFFVLLLMLGLSGCALFGDKTENSPVKLREALEVPPDLARPASDDLAAVPSSGVAALSDYAVKTPATPAGNVSPISTTGKPAAPASGSVRLERDGAQRWLVVQDSAGPVWVKARDYFLRNKIPLVVDNPQAGLLETDWIDRPVAYTGVFSRIIASLSSTGLRDKYRVRIEQGRVSGTAEIYVSHQGVEQVLSGQMAASNVTVVNWQPRPSDPEMEAEMLGKLLVYFGPDNQQATDQAAATQTVGQVAATDGKRAQLVKGELILSADDLDAAWRRVGQALDRAGVITEDRDRSAGIFYVRYVDSGQASKRESLFPWFRADPSNANATSDAKNELPTDRFQIRLKTMAAGTSVNVFDIKGEPDKSTTAEKLLGVLQQQLR
jgi:outer membrane protein assembly factor BamC